jgi:O-antigen/teichoic acid export membrane protein
MSKWFPRVGSRFDYVVHLTFAMRVSAAALSYVMFVLVGHNSSILTFTEFTLIFSIVTFCGSLVPVGQQMSAFKYLPPLLAADSPESRKFLLLHLRVLALSAPAFALGGIVFLFHSIGSQSAYQALVTSLTIVLTGFAEYLFVVSRVTGSMLWSIFLREIIWRCAFIIALGFAQFDGKYFSTVFLTSILFVATLICAAGLAISVLNVFRGHLGVGTTPTSKLPRGELKYFFGITILNSALVQIDPLLLGAVSLTPEIAAYFLAQRAIQLLSFFSYAFSMNLVDIVSLHFSRNEMAQIANLSRQVSRKAGLLSLATSIVMCIFAGDIIGLFRPDLRSYAALLPVLCIGHVVYAFGGLQSTIATLCGLEGEYMTWRSIVVFVFTLAKLAAAFSGRIMLFALISGAEMCSMTVIGVALARARFRIWIV